MRVRRTGKTYAHPFVLLYATESEETLTRVGISAGRAVGGAVQRNRAKRLLREATRTLLPMIAPRKDLVLIARTPLASANLIQTVDALKDLLQRARLLEQENDSTSVSTK